MSTPKRQAAPPTAEQGPIDAVKRRRPTGWVRGGVVFAAMAMVLVGFFHVVEGLAALFQRGIYLADPDRLFPFDLTVWSVVHLVIGVLLVLAGFAVGTARPWARLVGVVFATLSAVANFLFVPYSPAWSLTIISLDVVVIYALCVYRWDVTEHDQPVRSRGRDAGTERDATHGEVTPHDRTTCSPPARRRGFGRPRARPTDPNT